MHTHSRSPLLPQRKHPRSASALGPFFRRPKLQPRMLVSDGFRVFRRCYRRRTTGRHASKCETSSSNRRHRYFQNPNLSSATVARKLGKRHGKSENIKISLERKRGMNTWEVRLLEDACLYEWSHRWRRGALVVEEGWKLLPNLMIECGGTESCRGRRDLMSHLRNPGSLHRYNLVLSWFGGELQIFGPRRTEDIGRITNGDATPAYTDILGSGADRTNGYSSGCKKTGIHSFASAWPST